MRIIKFLNSIRPNLIKVHLCKERQYVAINQIAIGRLCRLPEFRLFIQLPPFIQILLKYRGTLFFAFCLSSGFLSLPIS